MREIEGKRRRGRETERERDGEGEREIEREPETILELLEIKDNKYQRYQFG